MPYKNLALFPLLSEYATSLDYLTLDEAFAGGLIEVGEIDQGGSVPEIKVVNRALGKEATRPVRVLGRIGVDVVILILIRNVV